MRLEATRIAEVSREAPVLYQGEVELEILPPADATEVLQFERRLRNSFEFKLLSTEGSPSKGSLVTLLLTEPQPLLQGLKQMPEVRGAVEEPIISSQEKGRLRSRFKSKGGKRILVTLGKS